MSTLLMPQLSLFGAPERPHAEPVRNPCKLPEPHGLDDYAFLYTATERGTNSGIRFMMPVEDAMRWCESAVSRGRHYSTEWAYFWTTVRSFIGAHNLYPEGQRHDATRGRPKIDIRRLVDNGEWDERIAALRLHKIGFPEFAGVLEPLGVEVLT